MRPEILAIAISATIVMSAHAEDRTTVLPEIVVGTTAPVSTEHQRCVDVTIGGDQSFGCLNEKLKRQVGQIIPVMNIAPIDAKSSDIKVGVVNMPGVQQQYGQNFGRSVIPYRPAPPIYTSPIGHR